MHPKAWITRAAYGLTLLSFLIPTIFLIWRIAHGHDLSPGVSPGGLSRTEDLRMLAECILGIVVVHLPSLLHHKMTVPTGLHFMYLLFLYCAIFLGEIHHFYDRLPHWDLILHGCSSLLSGSFGFLLTDLLRRQRRTRLSPLFAACFSLCFAVTLGTLWEIYEFFFDGLLDLNMQRFRLADGSLLIGREALTDTMQDLTLDILGAIAASAMGYLSLKRRKRKEKRKETKAAAPEVSGSVTETDPLPDTDEDIPMHPAEKR